MTLVPSRHSQALLEEPAPCLWLASARRAASMGAFHSAPHIDGSYPDAGRFPTPMADISTPAINTTAPSTALATLYKHALLTGHGAQILDLDRVPR
jgi:hypothetical protein